jgi:hypothetical protein
MEVLQAGATPTLYIELFSESDTEQLFPIDLSEFANITAWFVDAKSKYVYAKYSREQKTGYLPIEIISDTKYSIIVGVEVSKLLGATIDLEFQVRTEKDNISYPEGIEANIGICKDFTFEKNEIGYER